MDKIRPLNPSLPLIPWTLQAETICNARVAWLEPVSIGASIHNAFAHSQDAHRNGLVSVSQLKMQTKNSPVHIDACVGDALCVLKLRQACFVRPGNPL
jgi:hypothetical protein